MLMKMTLEDLAANKTEYKTATTGCHLKPSHLNDPLVKTLQCMEEKKKEKKQGNKPLDVNPIYYLLMAEGFHQSIYFILPQNKVSFVRSLQNQLVNSVKICSITREESPI